MKTPDETRQQLKKRFASKQRHWLCNAESPGHWPMEIALNPPSEEEAARNIDAVGAWAQKWRDWEGKGTVVWTERQWRRLGRQKLPERLLLRCPEDVASWAGEAGRWRHALERYRALTSRWPSLTQVLPRYFDLLADQADVEFTRLEAMLSWLETNPASGLYPRQLPVVGIDSKWLEARAKLITELMATLRDEKVVDNFNFYSVCGLRQMPALLRMRILDCRLRAYVGGLSDITAPTSDLALLHFRPERVFIVENLQTGLAFPETCGAVVIMGLGYSVDLLGAIPWLTGGRPIYWGDCDTHGFAILNRMRSHVPHVESVLMDERTLLMHRALWGTEPEQHASDELSHLTPEEQDVYRALKSNRLGENVRLEQERIEWCYALRQLGAL